MKKIVLFLLILSLLSPCLIACGKEDEESKERSEPVVLDSDSELVITLRDYLRDYYRGCDIIYIQRSTEDKIDHIKDLQFALLVDFEGANSYYVCAYSNSDHEEKFFCCVDDYIWVQYESACDIKEVYEDKTLVCAIQLDRSTFVKDIVSGKESEGCVECYRMFDTEFVFGRNVNSKIPLTPEAFLYMCIPEEDELYYISDKIVEGENSIIRCVKNETGKYRLSFLINSVSKEEIEYEEDLLTDFGDYYDELVSVMDTHKVIKNFRLITYGSVTIEDFVRIIKDE